MYYTDGSSSISNVKSTGYDIDYSFTKNGDEDVRKSRFGAENYPGGLFTVPDHVMAMDNHIGGDGGMQA